MGEIFEYFIKSKFSFFTPLLLRCLLITDYAVLMPYVNTVNKLLLMFFFNTKNTYKIYVNFRVVILKLYANNHRAYKNADSGSNWIQPVSTFLTKSQMIWRCSVDYPFSSKSKSLTGYMMILSVHHQCKEEKKVIVISDVLCTFFLDASPSVSLEVSTLLRFVFIILLLFLIVLSYMLVSLNMTLDFVYFWIMGNGMFVHLLHFFYFPLHSRGFTYVAAFSICFHYKLFCMESAMTSYSICW